MSFPNESPFYERIPDDVADALRQSHEEEARLRLAQTKLSEEVKRISRATVALYDIRAEIEDRLQGEGDERVRDLLQDFDGKVTDLLDTLN